MISDHTPFIIEKQFKVCAQYVFMFAVASGQSQAGCLQLSSVGRLLASSFTFDTQTWARYQASYPTVSKKAKEVYFPQFSFNV